MKIHGGGQITRSWDSSGNGIMQIPGHEGFIRRAEVGGAADSGFMHAPFHQVAGQERERRDPASQSLELLHLLSFMRSWTDQPGPSSRMWRALLIKLFLFLIFCTIRCHSQGKWYSNDPFPFTGCLMNDLLWTCRVVVFLLFHPVHLLPIKTDQVWKRLTDLLHEV